MVEETFEPGMTVSLVARRHGVATNQLFTWRRLVAQGGLTAAGSGEEVVPASDYRAPQNQVRELLRISQRRDGCFANSRTSVSLNSARQEDPPPHCRKQRNESDILLGKKTRHPTAENSETNPI